MLVEMKNDVSFFIHRWRHRQEVFDDNGQFSLRTPTAAAASMFWLVSINSRDWREAEKMCVQAHHGGTMVAPSATVRPH